MQRNLFRRNYFYGWNIAVTLAITETISWGVLYYAFSVFIKPMETELGWSRAQLTGGFSLALLVAGAMAYPVGSWIDRHGPRLLMTAGSVGASVLVALWSQVDNLVAFYLIWAGIGVCTAAVLYEPAFTVIAVWFVKRRSQALALVTFAAGFASTIFLPLSNALLGLMGWRDAVLALAILLAVTTIPLHAIMLRRRPEDMNLAPDGGPSGQNSTSARQQAIKLGDALNSRVFWILTVAFSLAALGDRAIRIHFIPFLIDNGVTANAAAFAAGSIGFMQVAGRLVFAPLDTRLPATVMVSGVFALQAVALGVLIIGTSPALVWIFIIVFGASVGARTLARPSIIAELFGASYYGRISSVMQFFLTLVGAGAPYAAGLVYDQFDTYTPLLWIVLALTLLAIAVMTPLKHASVNSRPPAASPP